MSRPGRLDNPTMQTIADQAGVSRATVCRVLQNHPQHGAGTREKVWRIARELGYLTNPLVSALMVQVRRGRRPSHAGVIALLSGERDPSAWRDVANGPIFGHYYDGIAVRAAQRGFRVEEMALGGLDPEGRRISSILFARGIHGVIVAPVPQSSVSGKVNLDWSRFSAATIGFSLTQPSLHRACNHSYQGAVQACSELARRGYRRIGLYIPARIQARVGRQWLAGVLVHQQGLPRARCVPVLEPPDWSKRALLAWMRAHRPDVVLSTGRGPLEDLRRAGYRVPEEVGYALLDRNSEETGLAGIDQQPEKIAAVAVDLVLDHLYRNERGIPPTPRTVMIEGRWQDDASVRPAPPV